MEHKTPDQMEHRQKALFFTVCASAAFIVAALVGYFGTPLNFEAYGVSVARGTFNQCTAVLVTCIALIVPLTANLYSPRLVRLYVTHPLLVTGLSILLGGQILLMVLVYFPEGHPLSRPLVYLVSILYLGVLVGALPFLYSISQFLRPQFFMPMLTKAATREIRKLEAGKNGSLQARNLFEGVGVVSNIALTGMNRGDRQLVLLALHSLHTTFTQIIGSSAADNSVWRTTDPYFIPGLAREGRDYLVREQIWPEAYVIGHMLKIMESANTRQQEIFAELAAALLDTALLSFFLGRNSVLELHVMTFNSMMADAVQEVNLRKFQNLSYYYRMLVENFQDDTDRMLDTIRHLVHYGKTAHEKKMHFAYETVIYDVGEMVLNVGREDENRALEIVDQMAAKLWKEGITEDGLLGKVTWRCVVRIFWEARVSGLDRLAQVVRETFLTDDTVHAEQIARVLVDNRELHTEFNDRLMRFAWISGPAADMARGFASSFAAE